MTAAHATPPARKRSRLVPAAVLGVAAFALTACQDEQVDASAFPDKASCDAAAAAGTSWFTSTDCDAAFAEALVEHERSAPRYDEQALCEEQHGGECMVAQDSGGSSIFMPLMAGYLMGSLLNNGARAQTQPLYRDSAGRFSNAAGSTVLNGNNGSTRMSPASFRPSPTTASAAPMSRAAVNATGGFGSSRTSAAPGVRATSGG